MKSFNRFAPLFFAALLVSTLGGVTVAGEQGKQYSAESPQGALSAVDDAAINAEVERQILREPSLHSSGIKVETSNGVVRLSGFASSQEKLLTAVQMANTVKGVKSVQNDMQVK
jgi:osmotically-inducible protein OsmY